MIGRTDAPLSGRGRAEVDRLRDRMRVAPPFVAVYTSPLRRANDTALALAEAGCGPLHVCEGLQEIDCGPLDGLPLDEVERRVPDLWSANQRHDDDRFRWPGGESYREFRCRSLAAIRTIAREHRGERVAVVTHAGVISQLVGALRGLSPARWDLYRPANTALTEIEWGYGTGTVVSFDDRTHLQE